MTRRHGTWSGDHHVNAGAALLGNGVLDRLFVFAVALTQGLEHFCLYGEFGPLGGLPQAAQVSGESLDQRVILPIHCSGLRRLAGVHLRIVLYPNKPGHYLTLATS